MFNDHFFNEFTYDLELDKGELGYNHFLSKINSDDGSINTQLRYDFDKNVLSKDLDYLLPYANLISFKDNLPEKVHRYILICCRLIQFDLIEFAKVAERLILFLKTLDKGIKISDSDMDLLKSVLSSDKLDSELANIVRRAIFNDKTPIDYMKGLDERKIYSSAESQETNLADIESLKPKSNTVSRSKMDQPKDRNVETDINVFKDGGFVGTYEKKLFTLMHRKLDSLEQLGHNVANVFNFYKAFYYSVSRGEDLIDLFINLNRFNDENCDLYHKLDLKNIDEEGECNGYTVICRDLLFHGIISSSEYKELNKYFNDKFEPANIFEDLPDKYVFLFAFFIKKGEGKYVRQFSFCGDGEVLSFPLFWIDKKENIEKSNDSTRFDIKKIYRRYMIIDNDYRVYRQCDPIPDLARTINERIVKQNQNIEEVDLNLLEFLKDHFNKCLQYANDEEKKNIQDVLDLGNDKSEDKHEKHRNKDH